MDIGSTSLWGSVWGSWSGGSDGRVATGGRVGSDKQKGRGPFRVPRPGVCRSCLVQTGGLQASAPPGAALRASANGLYDDTAAVRDVIAHETPPPRPVAWTGAAMDRRRRMAARGLMNIGHLLMRWMTFGGRR